MMEGMHPNAQAVMSGFLAFAQGDMDGMRALFTEDAVWHSGGKNKWTGDYEGVDAILSFFGEIAGEATVIDNQPHALLADDDHVVALVNSNLTRGDDSLTAQQIFIFHSKDGVASEVWVTAVDQYAVDAFWG